MDTMIRRKVVGTAAQWVGASFVSAAAFGVSTLLGLLAVGISLLGFGLAAELGGN